MPPASGPTIGTHHQPHHLGSPARNTALPQPATAVNSRGPKSRAGLIAYPALNPNVIPISTTSAPTPNGAKYGGRPIFFLSVIPKIQAINSAVPTIWSISPPGTVLKCWAGYVAKMPAVAVVPTPKPGVPRTPRS